MSGLGRNVPPDWGHVDKYRLEALENPPVHVPVVLGINWYSAFDTPTEDPQGKWWIAKTGNRLGSIRGGHCIALEPAPADSVQGKEQDNPAWWPWYDQGAEGACVGFGCSRVMSLLNRKRYQAFWLYRASQDLAGIPRSEDGSDVRAGLEVLRTAGNVACASGSKLQMTDKAIAKDQPIARHGISAYRWATSADEVLMALGTPDRDYVTLLNSWGKSYPHRVRMPASVLQRLLDEQGEAGVVTDR